ncbi:MAG: hydroxymethylglutaryl-CoA lyase [Deltaproteobacteria bacterium]|nr:hydroxymethylglutaryl-CoA lyase [Deltaproteobacteria bacterium]
MSKIIVHEVGPRDGLQAEKQIVPADQKLAWIRELIASGVDIVQVGSFVHKDKLPQMADTDDLFRALASEPKGATVLSGLVLNEKGMDRAMACGVEMLCMGASASETHSMKNVGAASLDSQTRIIAMAKKAIEAGKQVQVSVQCAFGCGYEGRVPDDRVIGMVRRYVDEGLRNISLADTAGHAHPEQVKRLFGEIFKLSDDLQCTCHFHDTYGLGMANIYTAMQMGVTTFETCFAGIGGCPFTKVVAGNVSTEDLVHSLQRNGDRKDIDLKKLNEVARSVAAFFARDMMGRVYKTEPIPY